MIEEEVDSAYGQLQRADHLLYVTLKYTRTGDIIKNTIKRLITTFDYAVLEILEVAKDNKKIKEIPFSPIARCDFLLKVFPKNKEIKSYYDLYFLMKKIDKSKFKVREEYRKNVTLITDDIEVNVETLKGYYLNVKIFVEFAKAYGRDNK
ncbi:hypothetical protein HYX19_05235 [Candidatus Woesearchaeota archaeon]|nr:hypothetical protein [Candidatus Woesearchaeota archaeon]